MYSRRMKLSSFLLAVGLSLFSGSASAEINMGFAAGDAQAASEVSQFYIPGNAILVPKGSKMVGGAGELLIDGALFPPSVVVADGAGGAGELLIDGALFPPSVVVAGGADGAGVPLTTTWLTVPKLTGYTASASFADIVAVSGMIDDNI